jgi:hypothetical protein
LATPSADVATITAPSGDVVFFRFSFGTKVPPISKLHLLQFFGFHAVEYDKLHCGQLPCPLAVHLVAFPVKNKKEYLKLQKRTKSLLLTMVHKATNQTYAFRVAIYCSGITREGLGGTNPPHLSQKSILRYLTPVRNVEGMHVM